ncbi:XRE family transcriptional regulator [Streptomyces sp. XM4193]|uniref:helix-turn-helix domain-containing protein n=1 Tax=Streptomyces sp. XM4193 TaxID=2929782 RepID=UPI001FF86683|nr:XRE family transcriptional regulator [Streptomyces sp. XM4193]MCK1797611.1 XRE family transcriptional regulator [Streptomyces sp. XM4193]
MTTEPTDRPEEVPAVAPRLRELRRRAGLTLEDAARRLNLSPAHLSRLETGRRQPSLPLLLTLSRGYGTTVSDLLGETPPEGSPVVRGGGTAELSAAGWHYREVSRRGRAMQALRLRLSPQTQRELVRTHPGEEWLHVLEGRVRLVLGETSYVLEPGDSAHYDSLTPHRLSAVSAEGAELLFVHTLLRGAGDELCVADEPSGGEDWRDGRHGR